MYIQPRQLIASLILASILLVLIIRLVQKGKLDIAYSWVWIGIGLGAMLVVVRYDVLIFVSKLIGAEMKTTTLFLLAHLVVMLMCLQFSLVVSKQRRQIRRLTQEVSLLRAEHAPGVAKDR